MSLLPFQKKIFFTKGLLQASYFCVTILESPHLMRIANGWRQQMWGLPGTITPWSEKQAPHEHNDTSAVVVINFGKCECAVAMWARLKQKLSTHYFFL